MASNTGTNKYGRLAAGVGIATAAAVGAAWANARSRQQAARVATAPAEAPGLIDWERVRQAADRLNANTEQSAEWRQQWNAYYSELVQRVVPIIEEYAHTSFPRTLDTARVVSRMDWVDANIESFQQLFEPIERLNREANKKSGAISQAVMGTINQNILSAEVGLLLGYLARRVLGQYDLSLLGKETINNGKIYFVEPNINGTVQNLNVNGDEFRLWIALHETTHAFEFESHPWVRPHFNSILERYFQFVSEDLTKTAQSGGMGGLMQRLRQNNGRDGGWIERVMTPEQHDLFQHLQALMSLIEGYSNHMMNAIGARLMPNYEEIKARVDQRQKSRSFIDRMFARLTGLDLKMEQYRQGEIFVDMVVEKKGMDFANLIWEDPKYLPSIEEVREPGLWITRVEEMQAA